MVRFADCYGLDGASFDSRQAICTSLSFNKPSAYCIAFVAPRKVARLVGHLSHLLVADCSASSTGGLPRKINLLAHHALLSALTRAKLATAGHVQAALPEVA